jgi:hypothetical protein
MTDQHPSDNLYGALSAEEAARWWRARAGHLAALLNRILARHKRDKGLLRNRCQECGCKWPCFTYTTAIEEEQ